MLRHLPGVATGISPRRVMVGRVTMNDPLLHPDHDSNPLVIALVWVAETIAWTLTLCVSFCSALRYR